MLDSRNWGTSRVINYVAPDWSIRAPIKNELIHSGCPQFQELRDIQSVFNSFFIGALIDPYFFFASIKRWTTTEALYSFRPFSLIISVHRFPTTFVFYWFAHGLFSSILIILPLLYHFSIVIFFTIFYILVHFTCLHQYFFTFNHQSWHR